MAQPDLRRSRRRQPPARESAERPAEAGPGEVQRGVIKWFNRDKGYGFIRCQDGEEVFVHESAVILGSNDLVLAKGREVEFELRQTARGNQAFSVVVLGESAREEEAQDERPEPQGRQQERQAPQPESEPSLDFSRKLPASWQRRPSAFVYTYTIFGRRGD